MLKYLRSDSSRFLRFVENRVSFIHDHSSIEDWHFVPGTNNVADIGSRCAKVNNFLKGKDWVNGPSFLRNSELIMFEEPRTFTENLELKTMAVFASS